MSAWLAIPLLVVGAAACPAHMWWAHRRGRQAACCPPSPNRETPPTEAVHARQQQLARQLAALGPERAPR